MKQHRDPVLAEISATTVGHYESNAVDFWEGTRSHDVSQNLAALLESIEGDPPFDVLDFGCGPGRDLAALRSLGHRPIGLDGAPAFVAMAKAYADVDVWQQDFLALDLPSVAFDGVFANATLFHVPSSELSRVLRDLHACLRPRGVLFASNPRGDDSEGWNGARYGAYRSEAAWRESFQGVGFELIREYFRPAGRPLAEQRWFASVWRRSG